MSFPAGHSLFLFPIQQPELEKKWEPRNPLAGLFSAKIQKSKPEFGKETRIQKVVKKIGKLSRKLSGKLERQGVRPKNEKKKVLTCFKLKN